MFIVYISDHYHGGWQMALVHGMPYGIFGRSTIHKLNVLNQKTSPTNR